MISDNKGIGWHSACYGGETPSMCSVPGRFTNTPETSIFSKPAMKDISKVVLQAHRGFCDESFRSG